METSLPFPPVLLDRLSRIGTILVWLDCKESVVRAYFRSGYTTRDDRYALSALLGGRSWPRDWDWAIRADGDLRKAGGLI